MRVPLGRYLALIVLVSSSPLPVWASDAPARFAEALRVDDGGKEGAAQAFALYRQAAESGLPQAEFNVAVMLDSGRGTAPDVAEAATWYARAAAHGNARAAYNLGQLYETGEGVPRNTELARAWFVASDLGAARSHLADLQVQAPAGSALSAPQPTFPNAGSPLDPQMGGVELVWTGQSQPQDVRFFVELRALDPTGSREVFSNFSETSSIFVPLPDPIGQYAWRVFTVARQARTYEASSWILFGFSR